MFLKRKDKIGLKEALLVASDKLDVSSASEGALGEQAADILSEESKDSRVASVEVKTPERIDDVLC